MTLDDKHSLIDYFSQFVNEQRRELLQAVLAQRSRHITLVLEDIYHTQNVSAVIRTAECEGLQEIHIIEKQNTYRLNPTVIKGASKWIEINRYKDKHNDSTRECLQGLKDRDYRIIATSLRDDAIPLEALIINEKIALCFGSEELGLSETANTMADDFIKIPMRGFTQSFNISVSAGICMHYLNNKIRKLGVDWQLGEEEKIDISVDWLMKSTPNGKYLLRDYMERNIINS